MYEKYFTFTNDNMSGNDRYYNKYKCSAPVLSLSLRQIKKVLV